MSRRLLYVACLVATLTGCATETERLVAAAPPSASHAGCPGSDGNAHIDWVDVAIVGDRHYQRVDVAPASIELGELVATTRCRIADVVRDPGYRLRDGDATFLPVGSQLRAVRGWDPAFRVAVRTGGEVALYEGQPTPTARTGADVFPGLRGRVTALLVLSAEDGRTEQARLSDKQKVADLVDDLMSSPYEEHRGGGPDRDVFLGLQLDDGTVVRRAYVSRTGVLLPGIRTPQRFQDEVRALLR